MIHSNYKSVQLTIVNALINVKPEGPGGGEVLPSKDYRGCAAGWGRIFATGLTIMGLHN